MDFAAAVALVEGSGRAAFSSGDLAQLEVLHKQAGGADADGVAEAKYVALVAQLSSVPSAPSTPLPKPRKQGVSTPSRMVQSLLQTTPLNSGGRPRARSLDSSFFVVSPLVSVEEVGERVKELAATTAPTPPQRILSHLVGVGNARDLGGLPAVRADGQPGRVRFGQILRCGQLSEASSEDAHWLVNEFAIKTLLDLRSEHHTLDGPLAEHFTEHVKITLPSHPAPSVSASPNGRLRVVVPLICRNVYRHVLEKNATMWKKMWLVLLMALVRVVGVLRRVASALPGVEWVLAPGLRALEHKLRDQVTSLSSHLFTHGGLSTVFSSILLQNQDNLMSSALRVAGNREMHPLAFHCAFGKDRTGLLAALLLHALGVSRKDIVEDFVLSHDYVFTTERGEREWQGLVREFPQMALVKHEFGASKAEHLLECLNEVEAAHGSVDAYLEKVLLLGEDWKQELRRHLVE